MKFFKKACLRFGGLKLRGGFRRSKPAVAAHPPAVAEHPPAVAEHPPAVAEHPPAVAEHPPAVAEHPPAVAEHPPAVAEHPPAVAEHPPAVAEHPPAVAAVPPPHPDGLVPIRSYFDLPPPGPVDMPPGILGFVFTFRYGPVIRTTARVIFVRGRDLVCSGFTLAHGHSRFIFVPGGRVFVGEEGAIIFFFNRSPLFLYDGEITIPLGGEVDFTNYG